MILIKKIERWYNHMKKYFILINNIVSIVLFCCVLGLYLFNEVNFWLPGIVILIGIIWNWYINRRFFKNSHAYNKKDKETKC